MRESFGLSAALATPFDADGEIAVSGVIAQARHCLSNGCKSVTLFGTTGEGASIGMQERQQVLAAMIAAGIAPSQIVMGVLVDAAEDAAAQAREALAHGVRNILLAPPPISRTSATMGFSSGSRPSSPCWAHMRAT